MRTVDQAMKPLDQIFQIIPGEKICLVGCGGKSALMYHLAHSLKRHSVLVTTTTHILNPTEGTFDYCHKGSKIPEKVLPGVHVLGERDWQPGKLKGVEPERLSEWVSRFDITLVEGDGSCRLPLKGWAQHEPVIPSWTTMTIGVVTLWPIGLPVSEELVFRLPLFCRLTGAKPGQLITLQHIANMIAMPEGLFKHSEGKRILFINQVESGNMKEYARQLSEMLANLGLDAIVAGSVHLAAGEIIYGGRVDT